MKLRLLMISLLFSAIAVKADIPGYMGLKLAAKAELGIMHPAIYGKRREAMPMFFVHGSVESAVSRAWVVGLRYGFMTCKTRPTDPNMYYNYYPGVDVNDYWGRFTQHTISAYVKKFPYKKGFIAPYGRYFLLGLYYQYGTDDFTVVERKNVNVNGIVQSKVIYQGYTGTVHFGGLMLGVGRNFIVANRMLIDLGFVINVPLTIILNRKNYGVAENFYLRNLLQINIGFGSLIF